MRFVGRVFGVVAAVATSAILTSVAGMPAAAAEPCPDVQVIFARGTFEPAGVGVTGQAFVDALTRKTRRQVRRRVSGQLSGVAGFRDGR